MDYGLDCRDWLMLTSYIVLDLDLLGQISALIIIIIIIIGETALFEPYPSLEDSTRFVLN
jgi:hypothetical protein